MAPAPGHRQSRVRGAGGSVAVWLVVAVALIAIVAMAALYADRPGEVADPPLSAPTLTSGEPPLVVPGLELGTPPAAEPVLTGVDPAAPSTASAAALQRALRGTLTSPDLGKHVEFAVAELGSRAPTLASGRPDLVTPASTLKLLTATAALHSLGADHRFSTSVVTGDKPHALVLVGGGDPLLTDVRPTQGETSLPFAEPASLAELAALTARRLRANGVRPVSLTYDDSLFTGPAVNPTWEPSYIPESIVSPVSALWVDEGRVDPDQATRVGDPANEAAQRFADLLGKRGIDVRGEPRSGRATAQAQEVARVDSAPLAAIVQHVIEVSDNEAAEVLLRHVALASGSPGSSLAGVESMTTALEGIGVDLRGAEILDGSGLSRDSVVPIRALVAIVQLAADQEHPELRSVVSSLPIAGFTGSLASRFVATAPAGLGVVRAKTGTLTGVHGLAGMVMTRAGSVLVFAVVADQVPPRLTLAARAQLERIATALSTCRC
ncbi:MAG: D-alanyl-D-alanine carboxypeptidase/D-alanyl-D-alanine-endopeptidase [Nocardioidaceae bacterium]|nr:D-alanyl-D-alanine carboxypeptidase/D-alanyl-D-alanine-endopeptidase [Nocardioidaceae bacterium]